MHLLWLHCVAIGQLNSVPALQPPEQRSLGHAQRGRLLRVEPPGRVCQVADVAAGRPLFSQGRHLQKDREVVKAEKASSQYILWEPSPLASGIRRFKEHFPGRLMQCLWAAAHAEV